jgi:hypothetical protein
MSFPIIINSTNEISNNTYRVSLSNTTDLSDYNVAVGTCQIYNSWYNINAQPLNNNQYTLTIPTSTIPVTLVITIPDGAYNISDLNNQLQYTLIENGYYIYNSTTLLNRFYCAWELDPTSYSIQFITYTLPTSLPSGFTSGGMTFPAGTEQYQLTISSTNNFGQIVGYNAGTYPSTSSSATTRTKVSDFTPNVSPISAVQMRLSCVYNHLSSNSQLLHVFTTNNQPLGSLIDASPNELQFVPCIGNHKELTLSFYDQLGNVLNMLDPNLVIKLVFKKKDKNQD